MVKNNILSLPDLANTSLTNIKGLGNEAFNKLKSLIMIMLPVLITSFFDASMENAHFPIIFYYLLGNIVKEKN